MTILQQRFRTQNNFYSASDDHKQTEEKNSFQLTSEEQNAIRRITQEIACTFRNKISTEGITEKIKEEICRNISNAVQMEPLSESSRSRVEQFTKANVVGLGPLEKYLDSPSVTEIIVQRFDNICVEESGIVHSVVASFLDEEHLRTIINRIVQPVGRSINLSTPIVDARLKDGSRVNATIPPVSPDGATLTIRKFSDSVLSGTDYLKFGSLNRPMLEFLARCVEGKISMIVSGGTSTGKTTLLNMLSSYVPENELIVTIEDSCELQLHQPNVRRMEARNDRNEGVMNINVQALVKNALRMRPDRIIIGEIRDGTIVDMMSAMSTGHEGSMSTVHANSPYNLINARFPILYSMSDASFSLEAQRMQIADALNLIVQITKLRDGSRKITAVTHVAGLDQQGQILLRDIFVYDLEKNVFQATGYVPEQILKKAKANGVTMEESLFRKEDGINNE